MELHKLLFGFTEILRLALFSGRYTVRRSSHISTEHRRLNPSGAIGPAHLRAANFFFLELGATGSVRTTMLRAYEREEVSRIIERLGPAPAT